MSDQTELDDDNRALLSRLVDLNVVIADLTAQAEAIKAELRNLPAGDYSANGNAVLRIIPTRRFDVLGAAALLDDEQREAALTLTYDPAAIKKHLTPAQVEEHMVENGRPKVVLI